MNVTVNGESRSIEAGSTVLDVVRMFLDTDKGVAVSVDRVVIPRSRWASWTLQQDATVEVLVGAAGG